MIHTGVHNIAQFYRRGDATAQLANEEITGALRKLYVSRITAAVRVDMNKDRDNSIKVNRVTSYY